MNSSIFIKKLLVNEKKYYIKTDWKENENDLFNIQIHDGHRCWTGRYSNEFAEECRKLVDEDQQEYNKNVKASLTSESDLFVYDFALFPDNDKSATFSWKKKFEGSVLLVHGRVPVHLDETVGTKDSFLDTLIDQNKNLRHLLEEYDLNIQMLNAELNQSRDELEKFINLKSSLEMSVYGKFIQLLNSKKRRIQMLEQNIEVLQVTGTLVDNEVD